MVNVIDLLKKKIGSLSLKKSACCGGQGKQASEKTEKEGCCGSQDHDHDDDHTTPGKGGCGCC